MAGCMDANPDLLRFNPTRCLEYQCGRLDEFENCPQVIAAKETGKEPPIKLIEGTNFIYIRHEDLYLVACSRLNANPGNSDVCC